MRSMSAYSQNSRIRELLKETKFHKFHEHILSHKSTLSQMSEENTWEENNNRHLKHPLAINQTLLYIRALGGEGGKS